MRYTPFEISNKAKITTMKTNEELQKDVQNAIRWEPSLRSSDIGVSVKDGIVTLTGIVDGYSQKVEAEEAARNVTGVKIVVEKIEVGSGNGNLKTDNEIASEIMNTFKWHWDIPNEKVNVKVENGWVTLTGELEWNYQKEAAKKTVGNLLGVKGIVNNIMIVKLSKARIDKKEIEEAIERNGHIDNINVNVDLFENIVTLNGIVDSWYQKSEAGRIARNAPGVLQVQNDLVVDLNEE